MNIRKLNQASIKEAAEVIRRGGMVLFPTDTVYILAVDACQKAAVEKLVAFKKRWTGKAISVAVTDEKMAENYVRLDEKSRKLFKNLLPGPFTIVLPGKHKCAPGIEAENGTLGIRIPDYKAVVELVALVGKPVTATSANLSGRSPHYSVASFWKTLSAKKKAMIDLVIDAGVLPKNKPSTVIDATMGDLKILRKGDLVAAGGEAMISKSVRQTEKIAEFVIKKIIKKGQFDQAIILGLSGDLGTGKTVFSRGLGKYLGIKEKITSPTFVIYNEYGITGKFDKFLHFDLYRIKDEYEFEEIRFFQQFRPGMIACIEWPENLGEKNLERLKKTGRYFGIGFEYKDEKSRKISFKLD